MLLGTKDQRGKTGFPAADIMNWMPRHLQSMDQTTYCDRHGPRAERWPAASSRRAGVERQQKRMADLAGVRGRADKHMGAQMPMRSFTRTGKARGLLEELGPKE